jgi:hypothetical protein
MKTTRVLFQACVAIVCGAAWGSRLYEVTGSCPLPYAIVLTVVTVVSVAVVRADVKEAK